MTRIAISIGEGRRPETATLVRVVAAEGSVEAADGRTEIAQEARRGRSGRAGWRSDRHARGIGREPHAQAALAEAAGPDGDPVAFEGPLALLLAVIEARQLDVLTVPLGGLAGAYLEAIAHLEGERLSRLSAFIAVAAQLILIKSRALLPRQPQHGPGTLEDEGPDPEQELRRRLIVYRAYRDAGAWLAARATAFGPLVRREPAAAQASGLAGARPAAEPPLDPCLLAAALRGAAHLAPPAPPPPEVVRRTVTLAERATVIREALRDAPAVVLQDLLGETSDRVFAAVTFLAMLELVKRREIAVEQDRPWGPIRCTPLTRPGVVDDAPIDESLEGFA